MAERRFFPVSCNYDCISGCPLEAHVEGRRVVKIRTSRFAGKYMRGCVRGYLSHSVLSSPRRLKTPLLRSGERGSEDFRPVGWEEALDFTAEKLEKLRSRYGGESILRIGGSGACRGVVHNTEALTRRFLSLSGGFTDTEGTFSSQATDFVKPYLFGRKHVGIDVKTLLSSRLIVLWGFNAAETRFGTETEQVLDEAVRRSIPIVSVDPRKTKTVERFSAEWIPVLPGSDALLMTAMLHVLLSEGLEDREFIERYSWGFGELESYVLGWEDGYEKSPEWAEELCGVDKETIRRLARRLAAASPAAILPGLSIQRTLGGEEADRLGAALQLAAGNIGTRGGSAGAGQWNVLPHPKIGAIPVPPNPLASSVPVYRWADTVLDEEEPAIRGIYSVGGNYMVQGSDIKKSRRAMSAVDFGVSHDPFFTETAKWCDVVLPTTTFLERRDVVKSSSNHLFYSERVVEPMEGVMNDYDIFAALGKRLGFGEEFTEGLSADEWVERCIEESEVDDVEEFRRTGIYLGKDEYRVGLSAFVEDPEKNPLPTPSGRIEIASEAYRKAGGPYIPKPLIPNPSIEHEKEKYPFRLVTPHAPARVNSQFHYVEELERLNDDRVRIHPKDAQERRIESDDAVVLESENGRMYSSALVTEGIRRGVLSCNQGVWPELNEREEDIAGSVNILSSTEPTKPSYGSRTHSIRVDIRKASM